MFGEYGNDESAAVMRGYGAANELLSRHNATGIAAIAQMMPHAYGLLQSAKGDVDQQNQAREFINSIRAFAPSVAYNKMGDWTPISPWNSMGDRSNPAIAKQQAFRGLIDQARREGFERLPDSVPIRNIGDAAINTYWHGEQMKKYEPANYIYESTKFSPAWSNFSVEEQKKLIDASQRYKASARALAVLNQNVLKDWYLDRISEDNNNDYNDIYEAALEQRRRVDELNAARIKTFKDYQANKAKNKNK